MISELEELMPKKDRHSDWEVGEILTAAQATMTRLIAARVIAVCRGGCSE